MPLIETKGAASAQGFGEFTSVTAPVYIESCFSTYLYTGNGSTQTITNGIDLSTKGGLVWIKRRNGTNIHSLFDSATSSNGQYYLSSNLTDALLDTGTSSVPFTSSGFSLNNASFQWNNSAGTYASWTFRKQPKFFDVVTYTGDGTSPRQIAHNLGSTPGCVMVKCTSTATNWAVWHRFIGSNQFLSLNTTDGVSTLSSIFGGVPTATTFTVSGGGVDVATNQSGQTYVAYLFAHNAGGFGLTGTDNVISCGTFTTDGSGNATVSLGYEPQWVLSKSAGSVESWYIVDNMRGFVASPGTTTAYLVPNGSGVENQWGSVYEPTATGFRITGEAASTTYIYIAIRRGPMKVPTSGTSVLGLNKYSETSDYQQITTGNLVDLGWQVLNGDGYKFFTRLVGAGYLNPASTDALNTSAATKFDYMNGFAPYYAGSVGAFNPREVYGFQRAPGFFDVVCYTGTGSATTFNHNLGVAPELIIAKCRNDTGQWAVYSSSLTASNFLFLNSTAASATNTAVWNATAPTSSVFSVGTSANTNSSGFTFVAYLFATVAGVSKVGSYTGTGATQTINCGFTAGARFVLIKRTDSTGDWWVYDSARGISSGNDPYLFLNSTAAEVTGTNYVDTDSTGFKVTAAAPAGLNANGGTYIFLAVA